MPARSLTERVEILEQKVGLLEPLPDRVAAVEPQILQHGCALVNRLPPCVRVPFCR